LPERLIEDGVIDHQPLEFLLVDPPPGSR
jgi:hypothetical protein